MACCFATICQSVFQQFPFIILVNNKIQKKKSDQNRDHARSKTYPKQFIVWGKKNPTHYNS